MSPYTIRILTLNIWNYNDPWSHRRNLIVQTVNDTNPDIIGFQEIRHDGQHDENGNNQAQQLAEHLSDYCYIYRPAQQNPERDQWEGLSIFSRLPILSSSHIQLSRNPEDDRDNHQRIVLHAELKTPSRPVHFFDTHLSLSQNARNRTVREITAFTNRYPLPHILVGDFNELPDQEAICHITANFQDAWNHLHPDDPGHTYSSENTYIDQKSETRHGRRIDYIFVQPSPKSQLVTCNRTADQPDPEGHFPSDHFGLIADISL